MNQDSSILADIKILFEQGDFQEAEKKCRIALAASDSDVGIGTFHGLILEKLDRFEEAVQTLRTEIARFPDTPDALYHLARQLISLEHREIEKGEVRAPYVLSFSWGKFDYPYRLNYAPSKLPEAIQCLRQCLACDASRNDARVLLGLTLFDDAETRLESAALIQQVAQESPDMIGGHFGLGRLAFWQGALELSEAALSHVLTIDPHYPNAQAFLALTRFGIKPTELPLAEIANQNVPGHCRTAEAISMLLSNTNITPPIRDRFTDLAAWYAKHLSNFAGELVRTTGAFVASARLLSAATRLNSDSAESCRGFGELMLASDSMDMAALGFRNALVHDPTDETAMKRHNLVMFIAGEDPPYPTLFEPPSIEDYLKFAEASCSTLDFRKAANFYKRGAEVYPDNFDLQLGLSETLAFQGLHEEALAPAELCWAMAPDDARIQTHMGALHLRSQHLSKAWPLLEGRFAFDRINSRTHGPNMPRWQGEPLEGKTLLIWREEGFGDEIRFASCLRDAVRNIECEKIILECEPRLQSLFSRSFPDIDVRPENLRSPDHDDADYHLPLLSLPSLYRNDIEHFPKSGKFLIADQGRIEKWKQRLNDLGGGSKIGLSWRSFNPSWRKRPFSSELNDWEPILRNDDAVLVNLQGDDCADEIRSAEARYGCTIHSFEDLDIKNDAEETAALLCALDSVVTCRCWITAFAGALGTPTHCFSAPYNLIMMDLPYDPWAPATQVYYRGYDENWDNCMKAISEALVEGQSA